jgi:ATP-binding cassette, subfamily C (CFTR/MRP), member 1
MVGLIYHYSLSTSSAENDLAAVTLMSTDVDTIAGSFILAFEMWAYTAEVIVGVWLLWRQLGPVAIGPVLIMVICFYAQKEIGNAMSKRRAVWTAAIQKRVALTSNLLRSMKGVKLTGMVETSAALVQTERIKELELGKKYRWLVTWMNGVGKAERNIQLETSLHEQGVCLIHSQR